MKGVSEVFISIVIPVFNREELITLTLGSVLSQAYSNFEIIVVDDGSTDGTKKAVNSIKHDKIHYHYKKNGERGAARNYGITKSKGEYVLFLDSDDLMKSDCLKEYNSLIQLHSDTDFFALDYEIIRGDSIRSSDVRSIGFLEPINYRFLLKGNVFACNFCVRKSSIRHLFQEDKKFTTMEDWLFLVENLKNHYMIVSQFIGVSQVDHDFRSMRSNHMRVIKANVEAEQYIDTSQALTEQEKRILHISSALLRSIHSYMGKLRRLGILNALVILKLQPTNFKAIMVLLKNVIGFETLSKFRK